MKSLRMSCRRFHRTCVTLLGLLGLLLAGCRTPLPAATPAVTPTLTTAPKLATVAPAPSRPDDYWPTADWRTSSPEAQGMDADRLGQMLAHIQQTRLALHSLLIIRHGYIVSETYFEPYQRATRHELYSCTKSFVATLVGIALDQGYIDHTDHRVLDYFPQYTFANPEASKTAMTVEDLLTMRSGLDWHEGDSAYASLYRSSDWVKYVLDEPMAQPPGSQFNYCSGCSHVLSAIVQRATGVNPRQYAEKNLFEPLGLTDVQWDTDAAGLPIGGWGLHITPRDMAKLGYLYLHAGDWEGQPVVSAAWVKTTTEKHTGTDGTLGYGYQWWTYPTWGAYAALGRYGQTIFVIPQADLVIVTTAALDNHDVIFQLIEDYIYPAVRN
jgi:CubicO group peptidase (beta-lactamase class C family)